MRKGHRTRCPSSFFSLQTIKNPLCLLKNRHLTGGNQPTEGRFGTTAVLGRGLLIGKAEGGKVKAVLLILGHLRFTEGENTAKEVVVDVELEEPPQQESKETDGKLIPRLIAIIIISGSILGVCVWYLVKKKRSESY